MRFEDYPPQEPLADYAMPYHREVQRRGAGVAYEEFPYGDDAYQGVLVAQAADPTGDVLAFLHGGGWTNGYKEWMAFMAPALTARGVTFASIGYRLAPGTLFPEGFHDALDGFATLRGRIGEFGGDPGRLFVGGHSAGGHYSSLMSVTDGWQAARGLPQDVVRGCLPVSGVYDFRRGNGMTMRPRFLGGEETGAEVPASPIANIALTPPFFMAWGSEDFPHLQTQAQSMAVALKAARGNVETMVLEGCDHFHANYEAGNPDGIWPARAAAWMAEQG